MEEARSLMGANSRSSFAVLAGVLGLAASSFAQAPPAQAPPPKSVFERYTEPIEIFKTGLGTFTRPISSTNQRSAGVLQPGLPDDVRVREARGGAVVPRSVEARSRLRHLLLGRGVGVGIVPERADERRRSAARLCRDSEGAGAEGRTRRRRRSARFIDAMAVRYVETFDPDKRVEQDKAYADAMAQASPTRYPDDLEIGDAATPTRCSCSSRAAARATSTSPNVQRLHHVLEAILAKDVHHPGACHLYVHATESTVVPGRAQRVRRVPRQLDSRAPATSTTCRRTPGTRSGGGAIRCARTSRRGIRI